MVNGISVIKKNPRVTGGIAVALASVMWGFDGIVLTPRLFNLDVVFVVFVLHLIPFLIMNFFLAGEYRHLMRFTWQDLAVLITIATFGGFIGTAAIVKALFLVNFQELSVVVLLQKLQPVFSIVLAALLLKEKIRKRFALWAGLAIAASYFLVFGVERPTFSPGNNTVYAALFALLASFSFSTSTVFSKKILLKYSFRTGTFFRYAFTTAILLLVVLFTGKLSQFEWVTPVNWAFFILIGITTGSGAIFLYYFGLIRINAMLATMCELFFPISAIYFDYLFNGKLLSTAQWVAAGLMIFAIIKLNQPGNRDEKVESEKNSR